MSTSRTRRIARTEVIDAVRSNALRVSVAVLGVIVISRLWATIGVLEQMTYPRMTALPLFQEIVPLLAIVLGYTSVVGERTSGRIRVLLGQPGTRRDVVLGKFLGRATAVIAIVAVVAIPMLAWLTTRVETASPTATVGGFAVLLLYAVAWVGATVGVSSATSSETRTVGVMIGLYALCLVLWNNLIISLLSLAISGQSNPVDELARFATLEEPTWYLYVNRLNPIQAFEGAIYYVPELLDSLVVGSSVSAPHAPNLFGVGVLLAWATIPLAVGVRRFDGADL